MIRIMRCKMVPGSDGCAVVDGGDGDGFTTERIFSALLMIACFGAYYHLPLVLISLSLIFATFDDDVSFCFHQNSLFSTSPPFQAKNMHTHTFLSLSLSLSLLSSLSYSLTLSPSHTNFSLLHFNTIISLFCSPCFLYFDSYPYFHLLH